MPTDPRLPADLFTACLTTPISVALRWFAMENPDSTGGAVLFSDDNAVEAVPAATSNDRPRFSIPLVFF